MKVDGDGHTIPGTVQTQTATINYSDGSVTGDITSHDTAGKEAQDLRSGMGWLDQPGGALLATEYTAAGAIVGTPEAPGIGTISGAAAGAAVGKLVGAEADRRGVTNRDVLGINAVRHLVPILVEGVKQAYCQWTLPCTH